MTSQNDLGDNSMPEAPATPRWLRFAASIRPWHCALIAAILSLPSLSVGWQIDDYLHRSALTHDDSHPFAVSSPSNLFAFIPGGADSIANDIKRGRLPWWTDLGLRIKFFRPIAGWMHWIDYQLWSHSPIWMHAHSIAWYAATAALAAILYRRLLPNPSLAGLASLIFAVDDAHAIPTAWLANRNAMMAACFALICLILHDVSRARKSLAFCAAALAALLLSVLSTEAGIAALGLLTAHAMLLDRGSWRTRLIALTPSMLVCGLWGAYYFGNQFGAARSNMYISPADASRFASAVLHRGPLLLWGLWCFPPADLYAVASESVRVGMIWTAMGFSCFLIVGLSRLARRPSASNVGFWVMAMLMAIVPVCGALPSDRLLCIAGIAAAPLIAQSIIVLLSASQDRPFRRMLCISGMGLFGVHLFIAPLNFVFMTMQIRNSWSPVAESARNLGGENLTGKDLIVVQTPSYFATMYVPVIRRLEGLTTPDRMIVLASTGRPVRLKRIDDHAVQITVDDGFLPIHDDAISGQGASTINDATSLGSHVLDPAYLFEELDGLFRDGRKGFRVGEVVDLMDIQISIVEVDARARPVSFTVRFTKHLDDASIRWVAFRNRSYQTVRLPLDGETIVLPPSSASRDGRMFPLESDHR